MKAEGYTFPALKESDAMFSSDVAPGWEDSDCCHRCRVKFGMVQRKVSFSIQKLFLNCSIICI